jgi:hypothetical protein
MRLAANKKQIPFGNDKKEEQAKARAKSRGKADSSASHPSQKN